MAMMETITIASLARLAGPLVGDLYRQAKKVGARGLDKWGVDASVRKIGTRLKALDTVRTIWKTEPISMQSFFHPPKLIIDRQPRFISRLNELPENNVIIEGIVGQGKSILLRSLAIEELRSNDAKRLPVFVELKDLTEKTDIQVTLFKTLESYDIAVDEDTLDYLFKSGKIALLLDGFDEIEEYLIKPTYLFIEQLARRYPELSIIVTSRPGYEIQKSAAFATLKVAPLLASEYPAFLQKLGVTGEKSVDLRQAIRSSPSNIGGLITTPLMLTLVVIVYEAEARIPETLPEFFEKLFQVVVSNHDRLKGGFTRTHQTGLSERGLQTVFEAFCFMTLRMGHNRSLSSNQFHEIFDKAIQYTGGLKCEADAFKNDITKTACLMLEEGLDSITYLHKSILDYYSAAYVKKMS